MGQGGGGGGKSGGDNGAGERQAQFEQKQLELNQRQMENEKKYQGDLLASQNARQLQQDTLAKTQADKDAALLKAGEEATKLRYKQYYGRETAVSGGTDTPLITRG